MVLLVDGHSCHIDIEISKFCNEHDILLYCLPPHSSHITQTLDVGFFKPLKVQWSKACEAFRLAHEGTPVHKEVFASVFRKAWEASVNMSINVNSFRGSGICPLSFDAIDKTRLGPSVPYSSLTTKTTAEKSLLEMKNLESFEKLTRPETVLCYNQRYEEGYDLETDELYMIWSQLKSLSISKQPKHTTTQPAEPVIPSKQQYVSSAVDEIITYPKPPVSKSTRQTYRSEIYQSICLVLK